MDKTLLKLEIGKWNEACRFLKSKQTELSTAEWTAIETLADYWRKKFDPDATSECMDLISTLEQSDKLHSNNKEIIVLLPGDGSKLLYGVKSFVPSPGSITLKTKLHF